MRLFGTNGPLREEAGDDLNLDLGGIPDSGDTPQTPETPAAPAFALEIDERTRYDDPAKAKEGFLNLKQDRDSHKTRAEKLEEENRRLKMALGGDPQAGKPKSTLTPEELEAQRKWLNKVKPELNILTIEDLERPEVQRALESIVERREQERLVSQGERQIDAVLSRHTIQLDEVEREALADWVGAVIGHPKSEVLRRRFLSGDMTVIDELVERRFAAEIKSKASTADAAERERQQNRDERGKFAKVQTAKEAMKKLPTAPPKGGAAPVPTPEQRTLSTPEARKRRMTELLDERLAG